MSDNEDEVKRDVSSDNQAKSVKLPYFHRQLSAEDNALIGDITPKLISNNPNISSMTCEEQKITNTNSGSAWNSANTWEERDMSEWAKDNLITLFADNEILPSINQYIISTKKPTKIEGHAQIAHVRGKARYIYEFSFDIACTINKQSSTSPSSVSSDDKQKYKANISIHDIINDQLDDLEISINWSDQKYTPPNSEITAVRNTILNNKTLKTFIISKMKSFENLFRNIQ